MPFLRPFAIAGSVSLADQAYAMEELVAKLGAAFLWADLRITEEPPMDQAAQYWHAFGFAPATRRSFRAISGKPRVGPAPAE